jgi:hypothetical protein
MNDVSLTRTIRGISRAGLPSVGKVFSADFPRFSRFRDRRPVAFSKERSLSRLQTDACEARSKPPEGSSTLPTAEDAKKKQRVKAMTICFTMLSLYHGRANNQSAKNLQISTAPPFAEALEINERKFQRNHIIPGHGSKSLTSRRDSLSAH